MSELLLEAQDLARHYSVSRGLFQPKATVKALNGVSFTKGCYVGQENTARMNWRQKVNRRLVAVPLAASDETRRVAAYPDLDLAIDHLRVESLDPASLPAWQRAGVLPVES